MKIWKSSKFNRNVIVTHDHCLFLKVYQEIEIVDFEASEKYHPLWRCCVMNVCTSCIHISWISASQRKELSTETKHIFFFGKVKDFFPFYLFIFFPLLAFVYRQFLFYRSFLGMENALHTLFLFYYYIILLLGVIFFLFSLCIYLYISSLKKLLDSSFQTW